VKRRSSDELTESRHSDAGASRCQSILELSNFTVADVQDIASPYWLSSVDQ